MAEDRPILSTKRLTPRPRRPADLEACLESEGRQADGKAPVAIWISNRLSFWR